uniref:Triple gene block protein1 n=1 Tax=Potexvirus alternantherae TaxID=85454 RepID=A0A125SVE3_9VIRU|nr:triple gene block protein1 [Alternanthera mosaic virus]
MNHFINLLIEEGYVRTNEILSDVLVVHAVAGAGKSTLIRKFIHQHPQARAYTHGVPDPPNLEGRFIQPFKTPDPSHFNILDEYCAEPLTGAWSVLIADPLQHRAQALRPHYIKKESHRLGAATCRLLTQVGLEVHSHREEDEVDYKGVFEGPLYGTVIALDATVRALLLKHGVHPLCPAEVLGSEFEETTVVSELPLSQIKFKHALYIALTRHRRILHVRAPPLPDSSSRPL